MNILIYQWGSVNDNALKYEAEIWSRQYLNIEGPVRFYYFAKKMTNYDLDPEFAMAFLEEVHKNKIDAVLGFNYFPMISSICEVARIKYISWIYDAPHKTLYSKTILNQCNYIFIFDRKLYELIKSRGVSRVYHQPLAVSVEYFESIISSHQTIQLNHDELKRVQSAITFVGSLYQDQHNYYDRLTHMKEKEELESLIKRNLFAYRNDFLEEHLTEQSRKDICEKANLYLDVSQYDNDAASFAADLIRKKITVEERKITLRELSYLYPTILYTDSKESEVFGIINYGYADYDVKMPYIFNESAINLNITLKSIQSGIPLRVLDILACGGFLITNWQKEIEECFDIGKELVTFNSFEELIEKVDYYIKRPQERRKIAEAGKQKVLEKFSFQKALENIFVETGVIKNRSSDSGLKSLEYYEKKFQNALTELEQIKMLFQIHEMEIASGKQTTILSNCDDKDLFEKFIKIKFYLRRMEIPMPQNTWIEFGDYVQQYNISMIAIMKIADMVIFNKNQMCNNLIYLFGHHNMKQYEATAKAWYEKIRIEKNGK